MLLTWPLVHPPEAPARPDSHRFRGPVDCRPRMAKSEKRPGITLACEECKRRNYQTTKNKVNDRERIEIKKFCAWCGKHTAHKETR